MAQPLPNIKESRGRSISNLMYTRPVSIVFSLHVLKSVIQNLVDMTEMVQLHWQMNLLLVSLCVVRDYKQFLLMSLVEPLTSIQLQYLRR